MEWSRLEDPGSDEFREAMEIYKSSFPPDERRTAGLQGKLARNKQYSFFIVLKEGASAAIFSEWNLGDFLFVEHLAVKRDLRGTGIGTELVKEYLSKNAKKIVLEVERPETAVAAKRIKFYEKVGFKLNRFDYIQPPYGKHKNPVPMFLMTCPKRISEPEFFQIREKLHRVVYGLEKPLLGRRVR